MRAATVVLWAVLLASAGSASADPVRALERAGSRLARTRFAEKELVALHGRGLTLSVRRGVIIATRIFSQRGFFLGGQSGTLSPEDRAELGRLIAKHAPGSTRRDVLRGLGRQIRDERAVERRLDPVIDGLLKARPGATGREVWKGARGSLVLRPDGLLVGYRGLSSEAFGGAGSSLAGDRDRLRSFLRAAE